MSEINFKERILYFFLALFLISFLMLSWLLWSFISIIIIAAVITGIFSPVYHYIRLKTSATLASMATCAIIFIILFIPIVFLVSMLSKEAYDLYLVAKSAVLSDEIKKLLEKSKIVDRAGLILSHFNISFTGAEIQREISEVGKVVALFLYNQASTVASNLFKFLINFFFMLLIIFFLLIDGHRLLEFIFELSPLPKAQGEKLILKFKDMAGAILVINGLGGLIQGVMGGIVFALFDLKSPILWGVLMGVLAFLPIVGIGVVFIPAVIYLFLAGRFGAGIFFIVFYLVLSGGVEYFFKPKLVGTKVKMHTLLVFLSVIGGLKIYGILGFIYGPLVVTAFLTMSDIYFSSYQSLIDPKNECT